MEFFNLTFYFLFYITYVFSQDVLVLDKDHPFDKCPKRMPYFKDYSCRLMNTTVHIHAKDMRVFPPQVVVPRCYTNSHCSANNKCLPVKSHIKKFHIQYSDHHQKRKCGEIDVTVHDACKCGCNISGKECTLKGKIFDPQACTCNCGKKFEQERKECKNLSIMEWDEDNCKCVCTSKNMACTTGQMWVPGVCGCRRVEN